MGHTRQELEARSYEELLESYAEAHNELYGYRTSNRRPAKEVLVDFWLNYDAEFEANRQREKADEQRFIALFEERIASVLELMPHATRQDAIGYITDESISQYGDEAIEDEFGLPYGYLKTKAA